MALLISNMFNRARVKITKIKAKKKKTSEEMGETGKKEKLW